MQKSLRLIGGSVAVVAALALVGCGTAAPEPEETSASDLSPEAQAALEIVEAGTVAFDEFVGPGPEFDASGISGGVVYYVPATLYVPVFNNVASALTEAFANFDIEVRVCDGQNNPSNIAGCLGQAVDAKASGVITHGIPQQMASTAFASVIEAGIPLVITQIAPAGEEDPKQVGYITPDNVLMQSWNANWIIADSNATANVLVVKITDNPAIAAWTDFGALGTFERGCAECEVTVIEANTSQLERLPSEVSAALVSNPDIDYVQAPFDLTIQPIQQGIQAAGRDDIPVVSMDGSLASLQALAAGSVAAEVGFNQQGLGWYAADQMLRMLSGEPSIPNVEFALRRIFTAENVGELTLTLEAEATGEWYGDADYKAGFLALWGVN